jgi:hypothetical protein
MIKELIKVEYKQFPKQPYSYVIWKYQLEYYSDGTIMFRGLWF